MPFIIEKSCKTKLSIVRLLSVPFLAVSATCNLCSGYLDNMQFHDHAMLLQAIAGLQGLGIYWVCVNKLTRINGCNLSGGSFEINIRANNETAALQSIKWYQWDRVITIKYCVYASSQSFLLHPHQNCYLI